MLAACANRRSPFCESGKNESSGSRERERERERGDEKKAEEEEKKRRKHTTAGCGVYRECVALLRSLRPPPASREGKGSRGAREVGKTAYQERTERHKTRRVKREQEREKTGECARGREDARGAKIRMSVGMPLGGGGGVYRVIQQERGRGKRGREKERQSRDMRG